MASAVSDNDRIRHSTALMVVLDIFPKIMRDMVCNNFPPNTVSSLIQTHPIFLNGLSPTEKKMISDMGNNGYNSLDVSVFYIVIRFIGLLSTPNQKWGNKPAFGDFNKGDDVERMRLLRNDVIHRPAGGLSEAEKNNFFRQSIEIDRRMDNTIGCPPIGYESKVEEMRSFSITSEKYTLLLEKYVEYQGRLQELTREPSIDFYFGNDIRVRIDAPANQLASGGRTSAYTLYLREPDFDINALIQMVDVFKEHLLKRDFTISLEDATSGSLNLHVTIQDKCFMTKEILQDSIQSFLHEFFLAASIPFKHGHIYTVVLGESDYCFGDAENKDDLDYLRERPSPVLKLNVNVKDSAFESEVLLYSEVNSFIANICNAVDMPFNGSARDVLMIANKECDRDSTTSSSGATQDSQLW